MTQEMSKELTLTHQSVPTISSKPRFITLESGREIARLTIPAIVDYLMRKGNEKHVTVGELSSVFCGGNTIPGKKRIRRNLSKVSILLARYGQFLITDTQTKDSPQDNARERWRHGRIVGVKLLNPAIKGEVDAAILRLEKARDRKEISLNHYELQKSALDRLAGAA